MKTHLALILAAALLLAGCASRPGPGPQIEDAPALGAGQGLQYVNPFADQPPAAMLVSDQAGCLLYAGELVAVGAYNLGVLCSRLLSD